MKGNESDQLGCAEKPRLLHASLRGRTLFRRTCGLAEDEGEAGANGLSGVCSCRSQVSAVIAVRTTCPRTTTHHWCPGTFHLGIGQRHLIVRQRPLQVEAL